MRDSLVTGLLRFFFDHLYTDLAWSYDFVAAAVSLGRWRDWIGAALPFVHGPTVLELAFGTGMLQQSLREGREDFVVGLDQSPQMARLAQRRLRRAGIRAQGLVRGAAELLPYAGSTFDTVVATFPSEFIFSQQTLGQVQRVLVDKGTLVLLPAAWIVGRDLFDRAAALLFRITRQAPPAPHSDATSRVIAILEQAGFTVRVETVEVRSSLVLVLSASK